MATTFHRRPLPDGLIAFAGVEGRALFREALANGTMEGYFALAEQFHTQAEPAFCGLGSLVVALNALGVDPGRSWKGPWRWFGEEMLDCCVPIDEVREVGLTLDEVACLARCNGARVHLHRAHEGSADELRQAIAAASRAPSGRVVVAAYARDVLGQTGSGHFSPIGGFHEGRDLALILDVARFKYPPHWAPIERLHAAILPCDPATSKARGFIELEGGARRSSILTELRPDAAWRPLLRDLAMTTPRRLGGVVAADGAEAARAVLAALPPALASSLVLTDAPSGAVRGALASSEARALVDAAGEPWRGNDAMALLLLALPARTLSTLSGPGRDALDGARRGANPAELEAEIALLREQLTALVELACCLRAASVDRRLPKTLLSLHGPSPDVRCRVRARDALGVQQRKDPAARRNRPRVMPSSGRVRQDSRPRMRGDDGNPDHVGEAHHVGRRRVRRQGAWLTCLRSCGSFRPRRDSVRASCVRWASFDTKAFHGGLAATSSWQSTTSPRSSRRSWPMRGAATPPFPRRISGASPGTPTTSWWGESPSATS
jgi:glutathione gamma-glutamylcysteinyltransferase